MVGGGGVEERGLVLALAAPSVGGGTYLVAKMRSFRRY